MDSIYSPHESIIGVVHTRNFRNPWFIFPKGILARLQSLTHYHTEYYENSKLQRVSYLVEVPLYRLMIL